ncbi:MAG: transcriptional repressor [Candidatus Shapirobacteria bacterium]|nr:transcriptional repressor [Candidatus Shapirobacteria bacterium]MDD3002301.1 transcriptional repressor [Candidatus Shapirobacteria bacterium]MDD4382694.1 transcriptional repressor [Candidatus Shapirobacteria bacterium]
MFDSDPTKICSTLKCRHTKLRMALGHIFHNTKTPISVADIQQIFKSQNFKINKTSIYRELKFLTKNYMLNEIQLDGISTRYEFNKTNPKSYLICTKCDQIIPIEIDNQIFETESQKISKKNNFIINRHSLIFFGHCHKCQQNHL